MTITAYEPTEEYDDYSTNIFRGVTEVPINTKRIRSVYYDSMNPLWDS
jgi:hypothetical protein